MSRVLENFMPSGEMNLPSSRRYIICYLIAAFIANEKTTFHHMNYCDDVVLTINALKKLGANFIYHDDSLIFLSRSEVNEKVELEVGHSSSLLRILLPIACYLHNDVIFIGHSNTFEYAFEMFDAIMSSQYGQIKKGYDRMEVIGGFLNGTFIIPGDIPSSYISGLLFLLALSKDRGKIEFNSKFFHQDYVAITLKVLNDFGYVFTMNHNEISLKEKRESNAQDIDFKSDGQVLSYFTVLGLFSQGIKMNHFHYDTLQSESHILDIAKKIGGQLSIKENVLTVQKSMLKPIDLDITNTPDLLPLLFVLSSKIKGTSHIRGIHRLNDKSLHEILIMKRELEKAMVQVIVKQKEIVIRGKENYQNDPILFDHENNHRIMMALSLFATINKGSYLFKDTWIMNKSYRDFLTSLDQLRKSKLAVSIYTNKQLASIISSADSFVLMAKNHSYVFDDLDLDAALELIKKNQKEAIIAMNKIYTEDELNKAKWFIHRYKDYKFLVSDLGICQIFKDLNLIENVIYDPDTLICNSSDLSLYQSYGFNATSMSNEIKIEDVISSYHKTKSNIFYQVFGRKLMFYSKRKLISLYQKHNQKKFPLKDLFLMEEKRNYKIPIYENKNGIYCYRPYYISLHQEMNRLSFLKYAFVESLTLNEEQLKEVLFIYQQLIHQEIDIHEADKEIKSLHLDIDDGFAYQDTIYVKEKIVQ